MTLSRRSVEVGLLVALCFFLPLFEAPKNILWAAYLIVWVVNRVRARDFGGRWDWWDTLIAAWIASGYVVAAFAGLDGDQWRGAADLFRYGSGLWVVKRSRFTTREIPWAFGAPARSTAIALALGHRRLLSGRLPQLQLNPVGHVTN